MARRRKSEGWDEETVNNVASGPPYQLDFRAVGHHWPPVAHHYVAVGVKGLGLDIAITSVIITNIIFYIFLYYYFFPNFSPKHKNNKSLNSKNGRLHGVYCTD